MASIAEVKVASTPRAPPGRPALVYEQSSQARKWHFTKDQLQQMRTASWASTKEKVLRAWKLEEDAPAPTSGTVTASGSAAEVSSQLPTQDEEQQLVTFYLMKIPGVATAFKLPELVHATGMTFMKRFYLHNSCLDYHPKNVMLTCLFLATKAENYPISLGAFSTRVAGKDATPGAVEETRKAIIDLEFPISQALDFEYAVHGVHRALNGLLIDILHVIGGDGQKELDEATTAEARKSASTSRLTDAEFLFAPASIAYACVRKTGQGKALCAQWLEETSKRAREVRRREMEERQEWRRELKRKEEEAEEEQKRKKQAGPKGKAVEEKPSSLADESAKREYDESELEERALGLTPDELEAVAQQIGEIIDTMEAQKANYTAEKMKDIDKRQKLCQDPAKVPGTKLHLKRQADKDAAAAARRKRKAASESARKVADPFTDDAPSMGNGGAGGQHASEAAKKQKLEQVTVEVEAK